MIVCEKMKEPFVLLENDFYLWDIYEESNFLNSELIVEDTFETPSEFSSEIERMKQNELTVRPRWYKFAKNKELQIPLKGIYGGTSVKFINDHATEVIRLTENEENLKHFQTDDARKRYINTHRIYDCWYLGAKIDAQKQECFVLRHSDIKYTHLYSDKKNDPENTIKLYNRVRQDLLNLCSRLKTKEIQFMILLLTIHTLLNPPRELKTFRVEKEIVVCDGINESFTSN